MALVDSILINKLNRGSRDAFLLLYDKYAHMAYNYALSMLGGDDQAAQDVVQECFFRIWQSRKSINPEGNFPAYLYVAARNSVLNELRRRKFADSFAQINLKSLEGSNSEDYTAFVDNTRVLAAVYGIVNGMPEAMKQIFLMRYQDELEISQIADALSLSRKTVETQLRRALNKILSNKELLL